MKKYRGRSCAAILDTSNIREIHYAMNENAKAYVERLEELIGCKIHLISVGAERNQFIIKENWL